MVGHYAMFPLELEDSNVVDTNDARGEVKGKRGVLVDTRRMKEKVMARVRSGASHNRDPQI